MIEVDQIIPKLGIGDLCSLKRYCISTGVYYKKIIINSDAIRFYKNLNNSYDYNIYIEFLSRFIRNLFQTEVEVRDGLGRYLLQDPIRDLSIKPSTILLNSYYTFENDNHIESTLDDNNYIVFHTKVRNDDSSNFHNTRKMLVHFFNKFRANMPIVILGERSISENIETIMHNTCCIYDELMLTTYNNIVIDLTQPTLTNGGIVYDTFERDLNYINKAYANVILGIGGPLSLSVSFCNNNIIFIEHETYTGSFSSVIKSIESDNNKISTNIDDFFTELYKFSIRN
jgi:hypothetical protein